MTPQLLWERRPWGQDGLGMDLHQHTFKGQQLNTSPCLSIFLSIKDRSRSLVMAQFIDHIY